MKKILNDFNRKGFVVLKNIFSESEIKKFNDETLRLENVLKAKYKPPYINLTKEGKLNTAHNLNKIFPKSSLMTISKNKKINNIVKKILNDDLELRNVEIFAKPKISGMRAPFHQDNYFWCVKDSKAVNIWISINKADKKNGGIIYLEGSHELGILKHIRSKTKGTSLRIKDSIIKNLKFKRVTPILNPGDCIIHDCAVIHGSKKNLSNKSRKGIVISFKAKKSKYDNTRLNHYRKNLKKSLQNY